MIKFIRHRLKTGDIPCVHVDGRDVIISEHPFLSHRLREAVKGIVKELGSNDTEIHIFYRIHPLNQILWTYGVCGRIRG